MHAAIAVNLGVSVSYRRVFMATTQVPMQLK
jgi:hypothetical protein